MQLILFLLVIGLPLLAQIYLWSVFATAKKTKASTNLTGQATAQKILDSQNLSSIPITQVPGKLTDHYDPVNKKLALSELVYSKTSIAAIAIAAHEVGHAIQDKEKYHFLVLRTYFYPVIGFSSKVAPFLILAGLFFAQLTFLLPVGILFFAVSVLFTLITLPVEFDASKRALASINSLGLVSPSEMPLAKKVLTAAALTYVAAAITAILELVRLVLIYRDRS
jgi:hypothetical protein